MAEGECKSKFSAEEARKQVKEACTNIVDKICSCIPDEVAMHLGNSKKELLLAIRSLIDDEIERTGRGAERVREARHKKQD